MADNTQTILNNCIEATNTANQAASSVNTVVNQTNEVLSQIIPIRNDLESSVSGSQVATEQATQATQAATQAANEAQDKATFAQDAGVGVNGVGAKMTEATNATLAATVVCQDVTQEAREVIDGINPKVNKLEQDNIAQSNKIVQLEQGESIYNVTVKVPLASGSYYTAATARAAVPTGVRKLGLVITYQTSATTWVTEQFFQGAISAWTTDANWKSFGAGGNITLTYTTDVATTRKLVPVSDRKQGLQISYSINGKQITELYKDTNYVDWAWASDSRWAKLASIEDALFSRNGKNINFAPDLRMVYTASQTANAVFGSGYVSGSWICNLASIKNKMPDFVNFIVTVEGDLSDNNYFTMCVHHPGYADWVAIKTAGTHIIKANVPTRDGGDFRFEISGKGEKTCRITNFYVGAGAAFTDEFYLEPSAVAVNKTKMDDGTILGIEESLLPISGMEYSCDTTSYFSCEIKGTASIAIRHGDTLQNLENISVQSENEWMRIYRKDVKKIRLTPSSGMSIRNVVFTNELVGALTNIVQQSPSMTTELFDSAPINYLADDGRIYTLPITGISQQNSKFVVTKNTQIIKLSSKISGKYIRLIDAEITGSQTIVVKNGNASVVATFSSTKEFYCGGEFDIIELSVSSGSCIFSQLYIGDSPYNKAHYKPNKVVNSIYNYDKNPFNVGHKDAAVFENQNAIKSSTLLSVTREGVSGYLILKCKTTADSLSVNTFNTLPTGGESDGSIQSITALKNTEFFISYTFRSDRIGAGIRITPTGGDIVVLETIMCDKIPNASTIFDYKKPALSVGGNYFRTLSDANTYTGECVQLGGLTLNKIASTSTPANNYTTTNVKGYDAVSRFEKIKRISLEKQTNRLHLITSDDVMWLNIDNNIYTCDRNNIESVIIAEGNNYKFDKAKLTLKFSGCGELQGGRELGNGEIAFIGYGSMRITEGGRSTLKTVNYPVAKTGVEIDGWLADGIGNIMVVGHYSSAPNWGYGTLFMSSDYGQSYELIFDVTSDVARNLLGEESRTGTHIHGCHYDKYRDAIIVLIGDFPQVTKSDGKILIMPNASSGGRTWERLETNMIGPKAEQYCTCYAMEHCVLFGTDMTPSGVTRQMRTSSSYGEAREFAITTGPSLNTIPSFTRPYAPNAPVGIHNSFVQTTGGHVDRSSVYLTADGVHFKKLWEDSVPHGMHDNNNARVWIDNKGLVTIMQYSSMFTTKSEIVIGEYKGFF